MVSVYKAMKWQGNDLSQAEGAITGYTGVRCLQKLFQLEWAGNFKTAHVSVKELVPIAIGAAIWGPQWSTQSIEVKCDNAAVVAVLNSGNSRDPELMHLLDACLFSWLNSNLPCMLPTLLGLRMYSQMHCLWINSCSFTHRQADSQLLFHKSWWTY